MGKYHERKTPRDNEYISAYVLCKSQTKAAKMCGVSRETIARAVRRANIPLNGRKFNDGSKNGMTKCTDEQLIKDFENLNCREIAIKYGMSEERVYRRAKKLGLNVSSKGSGGHWKHRAFFYGCKYESGITLKAVIERDNGICQICGLPIDDTDINNGHIGRMYPTLDHIIPLSKGGSHTWNNVQLAHMKCNAGKCDKMASTV